MAARRPGLLAIAIAAVIVVVLGSLAVAMLVDDDEAPAGLPWAFVIRAVRDGEQVRDDEALEDALTGALSLSDDSTALAFCANAADWMTDRTLDLPVVVGTDPALVRPAELAAAIRADAELITEVEMEYWQRDGDLDALERWSDGITDPVRRQAVAAYLDDRAQPPSAAALDRCVVYAAELTLTEQVIIYLDSERVVPATLAMAASANIDGELTVAGSGEWRTFDPDECTDIPL